MSPYRTPAKREPELHSFDWSGWVYKPSRLLVHVALFLVIYLGIHALLAAGVQYVVSGFAGHPIGHFWHYVVASILLGLVRFKIKVKRS